MLCNYYVYTLAKPDGTIFYVGKGTGQRAYEHERLVREGRYDPNRDKQTIIRTIIDAGDSVQTTIVARFTSEQAAYMYEWALIHMTTYAEHLTNKMPSMVAPAVSRRVEAAGEKVCLTQSYGHRNDWTQTVYFHDVRDVDEFCLRHNINRRMMLRMLNGEVDSYKRFRIIRNCDCGGSGSHL